LSRIFRPNPNMPTAPQTFAIRSSLFMATHSTEASRHGHAATGPTEPMTVKGANPVGDATLWIVILTCNPAGVTPRRQPDSST
jgi:hypothetical protein